MERDSSAVEAIVEALGSEPEDVALSLLLATADDSGEKEKLQNQLRKVCSELFQRIEVLNNIQGKIAGREHTTPLSGLTELYTGYEDDGIMADAETIFGQIELLNQALTNRVKRSIKKISTSLDDGDVVRLLEDDVSDSDDAQSAGASVDNERASQSDEESDAEEQDDEERKRIEARMQRAREDMDDDEDDDSHQEPSRRDTDDKSHNDESIVDPAAEELNDGFFDINEMEKFADEEEEYLPDEAFGEEKPEEDEEDQDKRSFHQKLREGDVDDNDEEDSEEEENALLFKKETTVRRKRYRDEEEIDALYEIYQDGRDDENDDEDSAMEAVNMTAADLYGKPNKRYYEKWNSKSSKKTEKSDDDSWNDYDFEKGDEKEASGWNDEEMDDGEDNQDTEKDNDEDGNSEDSEDEDEEVPLKSDSLKEKKTTTDKKVDKLQKQTEEMEKELIAEKPWQMRGETTGTARPVDSLLDSTPEFEVATKQAPIITVERTMDLEEVIKKRILNEDWDDVVPRELPDVAWNKNRGELPEVSQEKSKLGLGELYEREYMKKALGYDADAAEKETEEEKAKNEMRSLFANLCSKLDALSNYHFAPRPIAEEAEIRTVTKPAIAMEEVLPLHVSDARGVAPEEVYAGKRGRDAVLRGESELEQQDRKRLRAAKKAARRKARKEKEADEKLISKLQPGLGLNNPYEKRKMREELSAARAQGKVTTGAVDNNSYGKSTTFFHRMQQEAQQSIQGSSSKQMDLEDTKKRKSKSSAVKL